MKQYIGNGKTIQAVQWYRPSPSKSAFSEVEKMAKGMRGLCACSDGSLCVTANDVCHYAKPGDYIVRSQNGTIRPVSRDLFEALFKPAKD